jgi:hypothetical protein
LVIDRNACVLGDIDRAHESATLLRDRVGSTLSGTGCSRSWL